MKPESQFACLLIVEAGGENGVDVATFARRRWPDHKLLKQEGGEAQLCSGSGAILSGLAEENLLEKIGVGHDARFILTWQGRDFIASFARDRRKQPPAPVPALAAPPPPYNPELEAMRAENEQLRAQLAQSQSMFMQAATAGIEAIRDWRRRAEVAEKELASWTRADAIAKQLAPVLRVRLAAS